jgi:hypothetical protein
MDGLLSFALADNTAFGYTDNENADDFATEQCFRALISYDKMKETENAYNIYLQAKDTERTVTPPDNNVTTPPSDDDDDSPSTTYRITVSVMVPPEGGADGRYTYVRDSSKYTNLLGSTKTMTATAKTTALDVLTTALDQSKISYTETNGYVSEIGGLSEKDHGPNSGWQYMVDGSSPNVGASDYTFSSSGKMVWYYTDDYIREANGSAWSGDSSDSSSDSTSNTSSSNPSNSSSNSTTTDTENTAVPSFSDVTDHWASESIRAVCEKGWMVGTGEQSFSPDATANRAMIATVLWNLSGSVPTESTQTFSDVADDAWYAQAVAWTVSVGVVSGYNDSVFGADDNVTREQLVTMLYRCAALQGTTVDTDDQMAQFYDGTQVSLWAVPAMNWAINAGIVSGKPGNLLDPTGTATRAEIAVMLQNFAALLQK